MTAYTNTIDLSTVSTAQLYLWLESLSEVQADHEPQVLADAGFTIPATITHLENELTKRVLARVYSRRLTNRS